MRRVPVYAIQRAIQYLKEHRDNIRDCGLNPLDDSIDPQQEEWALEVDQIIDQLQTSLGEDDFDPVKTWTNANARIYDPNPDIPEVYDQSWDWVRKQRPDLYEE